MVQKEVSSQPQQGASKRKNDFDSGDLAEKSVGRATEKGLQNTEKIRGG